MNININLDTLYTIGQWLVVAGTALLIADWLRRYEVHVVICPRGAGLPADDQDAPSGATMKSEDWDWIETQLDRL